MNPMTNVPRRPCGAARVDYPASRAGARECLRRAARYGSCCLAHHNAGTIFRRSAFAHYHDFTAAGITLPLHQPTPDASLSRRFSQCRKLDNSENIRQGAVDIEIRLIPKASWDCRKCEPKSWKLLMTIESSSPGGRASRCRREIVGEFEAMAAVDPPLNFHRPALTKIRQSPMLFGCRLSCRPQSLFHPLFRKVIGNAAKDADISSDVAAMTRVGVLESNACCMSAFCRPENERGLIIAGFSSASPRRSGPLKVQRTNMIVNREVLRKVFPVNK